MRKFLTFCATLSMAAFAFAEPIYKHIDETGATVYSDRPAVPANTEATKIQLPPGPSQEEQQSAVQRMEDMQQQSESMRSERLAKEQERSQAQNAENEKDSQTSSWTSTSDPRRRDPKQLIPTESPTGGEHRIYTPGQGSPPVHGIPRPTPRRGR